MDVTRSGNGLPTQPPGLSTEGTRATRKSDRTSGATGPSPAPSGRGDRVTISDEALRLLDAAEGATPETVPTSTLTPERRAELLQRIAGGWYDRPEVKAAVVHELAGTLAQDDSPTDRP